MTPDQIQRITLIYASALTVMAGAAVSAALPSITENFRSAQNAELLTKLVITLPAICIAITSPLMGWLTDNLGRKPVLISSLLLYAIGGIVAIWSPSLVILLVCRAVLGVGVAGTATAVNAIVADRFKDEERNIFISQQSAATAISGVLFISIGGWLATFGWQFPFYVYVLAIPVLLLVMFSLRSAAPGNIKPERGPTNERMPPGIYQNYLIIFFAMIVFYMIPAQMPYLLTNQFKLSSTYTGMAISLAILGSALSSWNFARLQNKVPLQTLLLLAALINGAAYITIALASSLTIVIIALFASGIGNGLFMPVVSKRVMDLAPVTLRGSAMGGLYSSLFIGQFLSPILLLPVSNRFGLQSAYGIAGSIIVIADLLFYLVFLKKNKIQQGPSEIA